MVDKNERSVLFLVDKSELFIKPQRNADGVQREPLTVTLNLSHVERYDDIAYLTCKATARIDGFETEHLIKDNVVGTVGLAHQEIDHLGIHKRILELYPVIPFTSCHQ